MTTTIRTIENEVLHEAPYTEVLGDATEEARLQALRALSPNTVQYLATHPGVTSDFGDFLKKYPDMAMALEWLFSKDVPPSEAALRQTLQSWADPKIRESAKATAKAWAADKAPPNKYNLLRAEFWRTPVSIGPVTVPNWSFSLCVGGAFGLAAWLITRRE